ncbi:MAG: bacteriohemerythrin [Thermodesulfovibrionales bacterium]
MPLIEWKDNMSVGIREFDSHHQRLLQLINKLHDSVLAGNDSMILSEVLTEVLNYTMYHFFAEEAEMQKYAYPGIEQQKKEHLALTEKTLCLIQNFRENKEGIGQEVLDFLEEWWMHHILDTDVKYGPFLNDKGVC